MTTVSSSQVRTYEVRVNPAGALQQAGALVTPALVILDRQPITVEVGPLGVERALVDAFLAAGIEGAGIGACNTLTIHGTPVGHIQRVLAAVPAPRPANPTDDPEAFARVVGMTGPEPRR